ncbi:sensor histidine kinase [Marinobacterium lutimaris]|uniref:histidine kinase n=1 Tax=Marinobacterium lutimaris TaxID=568106 RepID=A0A1H6DF09_9GAMM|nr:ATP-binding protein [Marinobacterium lutimaris]SEG83889.1 Signal transduction histidine kinase regulating C4-dicarboxylate transport system [Marinobacterium lutimaris]
MSRDNSAASGLQSPRRLATGLITLLILLVSSGSYFAYQQLLKLYTQPISQQQSSDLNFSAATLSRELGHLRDLTLMIKRSPPVRIALNPYRSLDRNLLQRELIRFSRDHALISQVRWIDASGEERVRINFASGESEIVPPEELQNKANRYYFQQAMAYAPGQVYISPLDLNIERGQIERPLKPTIRAAIRTTEAETMREGVFVINYDLRALLNSIRTTYSDKSATEIINTTGFWLLSRAPEQEWGQILGKPEARLNRQLPKLWQQVNARSSANNVYLAGRIWSWERLALIERPGQGPEVLILLTSSSEDLFAGITGQLKLLVSLCALAVLALGSWLILLFMRSEARQRQLYQRINQEHQKLQQAHHSLVTAHRRQSVLQEELVETRKLSSLGMMVAGVAHELNTPTGGALMVLSSVEGQLSELEKSQGSSQQQAALARARQGMELATRNLNQVSRLITSFKRLALDRAVEEIRDVDLNDLVSDLKLALSPLLKKSPVTLEIDIPDNIRLYSHPGIISQILQNLIDNALTHAYTQQQSGQITLSARPIDASGSVLELSVADDGAGIAPGIRDTIFDPFVTSGRGRGHTGLGLHLVHQWVHRLLHGSIEVQSEPGRGSCFILRIPVDSRLSAEQ